MHWNQGGLLVEVVVGLVTEIVTLVTAIVEANNEQKK